MGERLDLSIIIPAYNEAQRIIPCLRGVIEYSRQWSGSVELIVICHGCIDETPRLARGVLKGNSLPFTLIVDPKNKGKGGAIKDGVQRARGSYSLFLDVDLSSPLKTLEGCKPFLRRKKPIIIGNRNYDSSVIKSSQPIHRQFLGSVFTSVANYILNLNFDDYTCGFKLFRQDVAKKIFSRLTINGFAFDAEVLFLAKKLDLTVVEIPVEWSHDPHSNFKAYKELFKITRDLVKIRLNDLRNVYE